MKKGNRLPFIYRLILRFLSLDDDFDQFCGDLEESYLIKINSSNKLSAHKFVISQLIKSVPGLIISSLFWGSIMIRNYLKIAIRNIFKNKLYSGINITGFAVGIAAAILTFLFVIDELRVNQHFDEVENIYQVKTKANLGGVLQDWRGCPPAAKQYLADTYPVIKEASVFGNGKSALLVRYKENRFIEDIQLGEFSFFKVFSHNIISGEIPDNKDINSVMIDDETAEKYFGTENPIGETIIIDGKFNLTVAAVFEKIKSNSTESFKILCPFGLIEQFWSKGASTTWYNYAYTVFVKTDDNLTLEDFNGEIKDIILKNAKQDWATPYLYPFKDKYLYDYSMIDNVKIYSIITILLLIVASVNYINLASAQSVKRAREVGLRKIVGARKKQIVFQFFFESLLITLLAVFLSGVIVYILFPYWKQFNQISMSLAQILFDIQILVGLALIILITTTLSCIYPAFIISSFLPQKVLKGEFKSSSSGRRIRSSLVFLQFAVSIILVTITLTVTNQINFMKNKNIGFDKEQVFYIPLHGNLHLKKRLLKTEIQKIPGVINLSLSSHLPGTGGNWNTASFMWKGKADSPRPIIYENGVDEDYLDTFNMKLIKGKKATQSIKPLRKIYVNETFANLINIEDIIGETVKSTWSKKEYQIIGVVKDFHHRSAKRKINPYIYYTDEERMPGYYLSVKFNASYIKQILSQAEEIAGDIEAEYPFSYTFLDEEFAKRYKTEERQQFTIQGFGFISIFVSCLGLLGMASFSVNQKRKEIGVRKVLGAGTNQVLVMLIKEFTKIVLIANVIAWPIAYFYLKSWLEGFAYRINLSYEVFLISGIIALSLAIFTVGWQAYKAAIANPVKSIRTE